MTLMRNFLLCLMLALVGPAAAVVKEVPLDELVPTKKHERAAGIIVDVVERHHYRDVELDDELSEAMFDNYLDQLDSGRNFFTQADVKELSRYRERMDDALEDPELEIAFEIFKRFRQRVERQAALALRLLNGNAFNFSRQETYRFDRSEVPRARDLRELDDLWRKRVKNDIIALKLDDKDHAEIHKDLTSRYKGLGRRVRQWNADDVFESFVNAFTLSIEPHTSYMAPRTSENFDIGMSLSLQGIGAVLRSEDEYTLVQSTIPGGPAKRSKQLKAGDRIVGVAQGRTGHMVDVVGWRLQDVVDKIRGRKGTLVRLRVLPKKVGTSGPARIISLVRDEINLEDQAASGEVLEGLPGLRGLRIGLVEIPTFYRDFRGQAVGKDDFRSTTRDVRRILLDLKRQKVDGIVIDLRENGGGSLIEARELTGLFIETGPVVQIKDSHGRLEIERDKDKDVAYEGPLAVLVDRHSASASEIFSGAIQDYGRGLIIGEPTFGKGTVQTLVDLNRFSRGGQVLGRLRLTMAQFFRVNGESTQHAGVTPHILYPTAETIEDTGERSLDNALPWSFIKAVDHPVRHISGIDQLRTRHQARIQGDPGFEYLTTRERLVSELTKRHTVSLVLAERKREWDSRNDKQLAARNKLRLVRGLPPLKSLDELEDDEDAEEDEDKDEDPEGIGRIMSDEAARILADSIASQSQPLTAARP